MLDPLRSVIVEGSGAVFQSIFQPFDINNNPLCSDLFINSFSNSKILSILNRKTPHSKVPICLLLLFKECFGYQKFVMTTFNTFLIKDISFVASS